MKRMSKFSWFGMIAGAIFTIISFVQYYMLHRDIDRVIAYPVIGLLIIAISWLYGRQLEHSNTILAMEDYLADNGK